MGKVSKFMHTTLQWMIHDEKEQMETSRFFAFLSLYSGTALIALAHRIVWVSHRPVGTGGGGGGGGEGGLPQPSD